MKLYKLKIEGYRRHKDTEIVFSDASFLIGENNTGKSSILKAIELLLGDQKKLTDDFFFKFSHEMGIETCEEIILTAEFRGVPNEALNWRGFKGRIFPYIEINEDGKEIEKKSIFYRKTFIPGKDRVIEMKARVKELKSEYENLNKISNFIDKGFDESLLKDTKYENTGKDVKMSKKILEEFMTYFESDFEFFDYSDTEEWVQNPGGISGNVLSKLPKVLYIPAHDGSENLGESKGSFQEILNELFNDVRNQSEHYKKAQEYLDKLAKEMDPEKSDTEFGKMMLELNGVLEGVFTGIGLSAEATLSDADKVIKPSFSVSMTSNIPTSVDMQGTGVIRSTVFALLRFKAIRDMKNHPTQRPLIICFEEPEIYLHPNAANQMRDTIYSLAMTSNNQIICSTHSPYMIDLGKQTGQVLNHLCTENIHIEIDSESTASCEVIKNEAFNIQNAFRELVDSEKDKVKLILKMDDYLSRIFFAKNILIVEGDTEELVLKETIFLMPDDLKKNVLSNWQIIRARGKASIIALVNYLTTMGITPYVLHDLDLETTGAAVMNEPIQRALNCDERLFTLENCIEDILGYTPPKSDKPYKAYKFIQENWNNDYSNINKDWIRIVEEIFS